MASANERIATAIREGISAGVYRPGERLTHRKLAQQLGVSIIPVAQALRRLEAAGLLRRMPDGGTCVPDMDRRQIEGAYVLREVFEGVAARLCAQNATDEDLAVLKVRLDRLLDRIRRGENRLEEERAFHRGLVEFSHLPILAQFHENIAMIQGVYASSPERGLRQGCDDRSEASHAALLEAIVRRDGDEAERLARIHVRQALELVRQGVGAAPSKPAAGKDASRGQERPRRSRRKAGDGSEAKGG
ncbi:MAG TPA: GntR family transcriptional regulator [Candidatus Brocadiia bacterium]|nr:GntR family transcriptional regulator [Candidatus Brocadiia bacterium]